MGAARDEVLILGGGVIGDTAGFAAATFLRGLHDKHAGKGLAIVGISLGSVQRRASAAVPPRR